MNLRLSYICVLAAAAAIAADDPGGWSKAKWGMTEQQMMEAFAPDAVRVDATRFHLPFQIKLLQGTEIAGMQFNVYLNPDKDGKLQSVSLAPARESDHNDVAFQQLQNALVQKYGRPWKTESKGTVELQWTLPTTVISLSFSQDKPTGINILSLSYRRKPGDNL